ncbi:hypothetical protein [Prosthecobacter sp.]|jgi:hypothetical protein|uniref:hypothetical protein n=1 Tax=Prosthecobacter sp. TaxID=1965333 RepID=UPI0037CC2915
MKLLTPLIAAAIRGAESLPPVERADVFEGIAQITAEQDPETSRNAQDLAKAIRDAEGLQLHFRNLFANAA